MSKKIEYIKYLLSVVSGILTSIFRATAKEIVVLFILICVDTIFGWLKAVKNKTWKSNAARIGAMSKIVELILIACLYLLDWVFGVDFLKYIGIYYFGICEISSILENYAQINSNLPEGIVELLQTARQSVSKKIVDTIKNIMNKW